MNIANWLTRIAEARREAPAIYFGRELVADYSTFHARAARVAGWLAAQGVVPGDRVGIFMKNCPDYLIVLFGIWYSGAVAVPINGKLHEREAAWIIDHAGAKVCFSSEKLAEDLAEAGAAAQIADPATESFDADPAAEPARRNPDDMAWLFYTSGTTGRPKGVMITHRMLTMMSLSYFSDVDAVTTDHATLYAAPMSHGAGLYALMHVIKGARHVCPVSSGFDPAEIFEMARHHENLHLFAAPTMVKRLTQAARSADEAGEGLRRVIYGGGPMYVADIIEAVDQFGPIFTQIYGQGEAPMAITALSADDVADRTHPRWRERLASVGRAQAGAEVIIGDENGHEAPRGQAGEIMVHGDLVMPGYWQNPEGTAKAIRNGWLMTGDVGVMDDDGFITLQDRSKDVIISGGTNIYPREVEECLLLHPDVSEVSVIGRPNAEWGEDVVAFVVSSGEELDDAILDAHCLNQIARFKRPKAYFHLVELPKNNYGKVLKTELREKLREMDDD